MPAVTTNLTTTYSLIQASPRHCIWRRGVRALILHQHGLGETWQQYHCYCCAQSPSLCCCAMHAQRAWLPRRSVHIPRVATVLCSVHTLISAYIIIIIIIPGPLFLPEPLFSPQTVPPASRALQCISSGPRGMPARGPTGPRWMPARGPATLPANDAGAASHLPPAARPGAGRQPSPGAARPAAST